MTKAKTAEVIDGGTDLIAKALENPVVLFTDTAKFNEFYTRVKAETDKLEPDTSTEKGRDAIRSMARKVVTTKSAINKAGLALTDEWRRQTAEVTASRKKMEDELAALAAEVRKPLTDWEDAEDKRVKACQDKIEWFTRCGVVTIEDTSETVMARGSKVFETELDPVAFSGFLDKAQAAKDLAIQLLFSAKERLTQEEADRAELEKLRAKQAERDAQDEKDRIARETAEREAQAARDAEAREAELLAEQERARAAAQEAAERAEQERAALVERERAEAAERASDQARADAQKLIDEANARAAEAEAREAAEAQRLADEKAAADAREKDKAHRTKVLTAAKVAIMSCGVEETVAKAIVLAIRAGEVPHTSITF